MAHVDHPTAALDLEIAPTAHIAQTVFANLHHLVMTNSIARLTGLCVKSLTVWTQSLAIMETVLPDTHALITTTHRFVCQMAPVSVPKIFSVQPANTVTYSATHAPQVAETMLIALGNAEILHCVPVTTTVNVSPMEAAHWADLAISMRIVPAEPFAPTMIRKPELPVI